MKKVIPVLKDRKGIPERPAPPAPVVRKVPMAPWAPLVHRV